MYDNSIKWDDPTSKISKYFTVKEALWLHQWGVLHEPSEDEKSNIAKTALTMDKIREFLNAPISVSCWVRPNKTHCINPKYDGGDYNGLIGGAARSLHIKGLAVDFVVSGSKCDDIRKLLLPKLAEFNMRMENKPGSVWVHMDKLEVEDKYRFFLP